MFDFIEQREEYMDPVQKDGRIVMQYDYFRERFDATKWFKNGMYRLKTDSWDSYLMDDQMLRVSVPPVPDSELRLLRASLVVGLDPVMLELHGNDFNYAPPPESYKEILTDNRFDPRPLMIYAYSFFKDIDKPRDIFVVYLLIEGKRYFVRLERDAMTGEIESTRRWFMVRVGDERGNWLFKRLEDRQKGLIPVSKDTEFPTAVLGGVPCPKSGNWWVRYMPGERFFNKGEKMPELSKKNETGGYDPVWYRVDE